MLGILLPAVAFAALLIASYTDIRTREVPDWLNYGLILGALGIRAIFSTRLGWTILLSGLLGLGICIALGYLFYYTNQWGGGDSKLLMGMGAVIGVQYPFAAASANLAWFFAALLFLGALYGVLWMVGVALQQRRIFARRFLAALGEHRKLHLALTLLTITLAFPAAMNNFFIPLAAFPLGMFYLLMFVNTVEGCCFVNPVSASKLTEGDWLAKAVVVGGRKILRRKTLESTDISRLRRLEVQGKLKSVLIKEGVPFIPSFLLAYFFLMAGGVGWIVRVAL